ncbi:MAG: type IV pilin N-terminal domain-containing protein [Methanoregula sp.]|jgi:FlaG/FlaF family flagellin (archaellin)|uniref:type IV pilin N-terminal domain-containing protein n=1 Tax=Methanoregula sp. TaxID=2052170 RepID=UPI0025FC794E|nr:type IV pilin N-terminal domain-containing protein [Methanoregula sp.]MCK9630479.1 type IV pilin N-terminal domain-containing protein [Methanoregula sp.]
MTSRKIAVPKIRVHPGYGGADGVSEVIGAILLVGLVVAAVAVVAVALFSQSTPVKVPNVNFMVGTDNHVPPTLYLTHNGGDTLTAGSFSVYVDGNIKSYSVAGGGNQWSLGKNLLVPLSSGEAPQRIYLVYNQTGTGSSVIGSASANVSVPSGNVAPDIIVRTTSAPIVCINGSDPQEVLGAVLSNVSVIGAAMNQSPSTVGPVIANVVGANSINFYRDGKATIDQNTYLLLNITGSGSTIAYDTTTPQNLGIGDTLLITQRNSNPGTWKIFGIGNQIWEFTAPDSNSVDVYWRHKSTGLWSNTSSTRLYHTWITGYNDVGSTLTLRTTQGGYYTGLVINGTIIIDGVSSNTVVVQNIRPVGVGLFVLEYDPNSNSVYFMGNAQSVTW